MPQLRLRFSLGQLLGATAAVAVVFALTVATVPAQFRDGYLLALTLLTVGTCLVSICGLSSWLRAATWLSSFYPSLILLSLHATWLTAWFRLGRPPRPHFDDPKFIGPVVSVAHSFTWALMAGFDPSLLIFGLLVVTCCVHTFIRRRGMDRGAILRLVVPPLLWLFSTVAIFADPFRILYWFQD
jgi:hypothetical protein